MSAKKENSLSLVLRLVDKATGPLKHFGHQLKALNDPGKRLGHALHEIGEQSGLFKIGEGLKGVGEGFHKVGEKALEFGKELALMTLEAGFVAYEVIHHFVEIGDQLKKTSERLGLTVDGFAELDFVAKRSGMSTEELTTNLDKFNKGMGEAKLGSGSLLKALGHTPAAFKKQVLGAKSNEEALDLMFAAMEKIPDANLRAAFATEVFGKSGAKMVNLMKGGPEEIKKLRAEFHRLAGSQEKFAEGAEVLDDAIQDVKTAFQGLGAAAVTELFPALTELAGVTKEFLVDNREGIRTWARDTARAITDWVKGGGIQRLADGFKSLLATVKPIVDKLGGWPIVLAGIAGAITAGPLLAAIAGLASSFVTLGIAMVSTPFGLVLTGVAALAAGGVLLWKNWDAVSKFFKTFFPEFSKGVSDAADSIVWLIKGVEKLIDVYTAWENMRAIRAGEAGKAAPEKIATQAGRGLWNATLGMTGLSNPFGLPPELRPSSGAVAARGALGAPQQAKVTVDFNNAPRGTRTTIAPGSTADVDISTGISMASP